MNKFSVGFSKPKKFKPLAFLIMLVGGTKYSHTFNTWKCTEISRRKVFVAVGSGIRIISNVTFKEQAKVVELYYIYATDEEIVKAEQLAHDMAGRDYGYMALVGLALKKALDCINRIFKLNLKIKNIFRDGNKSNICIEASARQFCEIAKIPIPEDIESYDLSDYNALVKKHANPVSQQKIDRINGKV